jgi:flagellar hook-associated protein 2
MAVSSPGLGSNLDVNSIVSQLMAVEKRPLTVLAQKQAGFQAKISALGSLQGTISAMQTAAGNLVPVSGTTAAQKFTVLRTSVADTTIASATTTSSAVAGTYSLAVTQLATQHSIATPGGASSPFSGTNGTLSDGGTLTLALGTADGVTVSKTTDITIADDATPEAIRDAINAANAGVAALVINGTDGKQLLLTSDTAGSNQVIQISGSTGLSYVAPEARHHSVSTDSGVFSGVGGTLPLGDSDGSNTNKTTDVPIAADSTPEMMRDAINSASTGVTAKVIDGTSGKQLVLTSNTGGSNQFIELSGSAAPANTRSDPVEPVDTFTQTHAALGATFTLNGVAVSSATNTVTTAIDGITLNLLKGPEAPATSLSTTLTISKDNSSLTTGVNALVKAINDFQSTARNLGSYDAASKKAGTLNGDSTLRTAQNSFRSALGEVPSALAGASLQRLSDIGVSLQKDGTLTVDAAKLSTAIGKDLNGVANLVAAYGSAVKSVADGLVGSGGLIAARSDGLNSSISNLGKQSTVISDRLVQIEARYRKQFTSLDTLIAGMTTTSNFLTQQLANLPKYSSS